MKFIHLFLCLFLLFSCGEAQEDETESSIFINDPQIPGGTLGDQGELRGVFNVNFDLSVFNQITITWDIPSLYETEDWRVVLYKVRSDGQFQDVVIENPGTDLNGVPFELTRIKETRYVDTNISQNQGYFYWIFIVVNGDEVTGSQNGLWSRSVKYEVNTPFENSTIDFPPVSEFWTKVEWNDFIVGPFTQEPRHNFQTYETSTSSIGNPKGDLDYAFGGSLLFVSDTDNNRILVFDDQSLRSCEEFVEDDFLYFACRLGALSSRAQAYNILGQPNDESTKSCQEHQLDCDSSLDENSCSAQNFCTWRNNSCVVEANKCLTSPTGLHIDGNKLLVADSGNNRILMYDDVLFDPPNSDGSIAQKRPISCDPEVIPTRIVPIKCEASKVFGKQNLFDIFNVYDINFDGISILDYPTGITTHNDDLYIADTHNNRVVKVRDYQESNSYLCSDGSDGGSVTWKTALCSWQGLLGQASYNEKKSFQDFFDDDTSILSGTFNNKLVNDDYLLKRYFKNPNIIKFFTHVTLPLRETLILDNTWTDAIRRQIIINQGDISSINEISDSIKANFSQRENNIETKLLVASNEDFSEVAGLGTQVALKGRVLIYDENPLEGFNTPCNLATFNSGDCDANDILGQDSTDEVVIINSTGGGAGNYTNLNFTLETIGGLDIMQERLLVTDFINNTIYVYENFPKRPGNTWSHSAKVEDPAGEFQPALNQNLPDLESISGMRFDEDSGKLFILDSGDSKLYQLSFEDLIPST